MMMTDNRMHAHSPADISDRTRGGSGLRQIDVWIRVGINRPRRTRMETHASRRDGLVILVLVAFFSSSVHGHPGSVDHRARARARAHHRYRYPETLHALWL
jgi:hypothetical protein